MNQVYCLYRVSTNHQLLEDDIPMQRQACHEFAEAHGWAIIQEFYERGISGFTTPTAARNVLQQIKKDAALKKFDILLVFMFDRLGRRDTETPFFVEDIAVNGIQIWSVKEGQQRFESHADKLINYIRYWQASGESLKTSERIKTRMGQLAREGIFYGGQCPYGYRLVKTGRKNPRGHEVHDLAIESSEATIIKKIFEYYIRYGYGSRKISSELAAQGIFNRKSEPFHPSSINSLLNRELLMGIIRRGTSKSAIIPSLQIITPEIFQMAQKITEMRKQNQIPQKVVGQALLSGNLYCGHCGGRMFAITTRKSHHATSKATERIPVYKCYNRVQHRIQCPGQSAYYARRIDDVVMLALEQSVKEADRTAASLLTTFQKAERPIQKMIARQWISRVVVFSYSRIETSLQPKPSDIIAQCLSLEQT